MGASLFPKGLMLPLKKRVVKKDKSQMHERKTISSINKERDAILFRKKIQERKKAAAKKKAAREKAEAEKREKLRKQWEAQREKRNRDRDSRRSGKKGKKKKKDKSKEPWTLQKTLKVGSDVR